MIDTILFDMDGVICHTNPYHSKAFHVFFEKRGLAPTEAEYREHMYGRPNSYIFSHFLGRDISKEELALFENEKEGLFREIYQSEVKPINGYMEFLELVATHGFKLGVATSAPRANMDMILDTLDIRGYFTSTLANEDVTTHKPSPEVYLKSASALSSQANTCLVFEDSNSGVKAAINAGMQVIGVLSSHTKEELPPCDTYIDKYSTELFEKLLQGS